MQRSLKELEQQAQELSGCKNFNLSNNGEVSDVLFKTLKLPVPPNSKHIVRTDKYTVGAEVRRTYLFVSSMGPDKFYLLPLQLLL